MHSLLALPFGSQVLRMQPLALVVVLLRLVGGGSLLCLQRHLTGQIGRAQVEREWGGQGPPAPAGPWALPSSQLLSSGVLHATVAQPAVEQELRYSIKDVGAGCAHLLRKYRMRRACWYTRTPNMCWAPGILNELENILQAIITARVCQGQ